MMFVEMFCCGWCFVWQDKFKTLCTRLVASFQNHKLHKATFTNGSQHSIHLHGIALYVHVEPLVRSVCSIASLVRLFAGNRFGTASHKRWQL